MVRKSTWMALHAVAYTPLTTAWTLTWRNETAGATIEHQDTALTCTRIYHEKGEDFSWDPEGAWCMDFWAEPTCDTRIGYSCDGRVWEKAASRNLSAFDVYPMPVESRRVYGFLSTSATPSPTAAATTLTVTHPAATSATQTAEAEGEGDSGSSLSGGAIAGIVIGDVAGARGPVVACASAAAASSRSRGGDVSHRYESELSHAVYAAYPARGVPVRTQVPHVGGVGDPVDVFGCAAVLAAGQRVSAAVCGAGRGASREL
ncbi:predicted protein [Aspergillus terreus NIH2624]|uniref:Uncharacterized protein n=1 Tax=Aspergillus terreus (strain NIH 2624 / FGSC A1156) TaxID=341663 RepID=Q0CFF4_ASPTN|nr:uncharacterized protein ATEG_07580 [Aspergillus terreus NIH2624]EAU31842.1 predicted protein [Aspergillus terreus NIH2624]